MNPNAHAITFVVEPFLNLFADSIYNPLNGKTLTHGDPRFQTVKALLDGSSSIANCSLKTQQHLIDDAWLVKDQGDTLARRYRLRIASLEATTHCNQSCYFCPVSIKPRARESMGMDKYADIVEQLAQFRDTLEGVFIMAYNEPMIDPLFLERVRILKKCGLQPAVNTNGTALTAKHVDALMEMGGLAYLSVNLSTLDRERYARERGRDHLPKVLANLDYAGKHRIAPQMDVAVLGTDAATTHQDFVAIDQRLGNTYFKVREFSATNRAGQLQQGEKPEASHTQLHGCDNLGSRPIEHIHINAAGQCLLCCQDYSANYIMGNLKQHSLEEILVSDQAAGLRKQVYGLAPSKQDFICRHCVFALTRQ